MMGMEQITEQDMATGFKERLIDLLISRSKNVKCNEPRVSKLLEEIKPMNNQNKIVKHIFDNYTDYVLWGATNEKDGMAFLTKADYKGFCKYIRKEGKKNMKDKNKRKLFTLSKKYKRYQGE